MAVNHPTKKFGKKPPRYDKRTLRFSDYVIKLPPIPSGVNYSKLDWPAMGNAGRGAVGDCVMAAIGHEVEEWTTFGAGAPRYPSDQQVVDAYFQLTGGVDSGLVILDTLNVWRQQGFWNDKIDAYVALEPGNIDQAKAAIYLFGNVNIGMALPDTNTFGPWDDAAGSGPPDFGNGHCVTLVGYDSTGFYAVTWGDVIHMSWAWYEKYAGPLGQGEAYAILSKDWLNAKGLDPDGFDYLALSDDLAQITGSPPLPPVQPPPVNPPPRPTNWTLIIMASAIVIGIAVILKVLHVF